MNNPDFTTDKQLFYKRVKYLSVLFECFWSWWRNEYLLSLRKYHRAVSKNEELVKVGSIVQIHDNGPRLKWNLGLVTDVQHIRDELPDVQMKHSVTLKTSNKVTNHPLSKLYSLELCCSDKESALSHQRREAENPGNCT